MNKKTGIFLVLLIVGIITTIVISVSLAKKDVEEYQDMKGTLEQTEQQTEKYNEAVEKFDQQNEAVYDSLNEQLDY